MHDACAGLPGPVAPPVRAAIRAVAVQRPAAAGVLRTQPAHPCCCVSVCSCLLECCCALCAVVCCVAVGSQLGNHGHDPRIQSIDTSAFTCLFLLYSFICFIYLLPFAVRSHRVLLSRPVHLGPGRNARSRLCRRRRHPPPTTTTTSQQGRHLCHSPHGATSPFRCTPAVTGHCHRAGLG